MGLFKKNKKETKNTKKNKQNSEESLELPELPESPSLSEPPRIQEIDHKDRISKLPSFPQSSPNSKMNNDIVKQAVKSDSDNEEQNFHETEVKLPSLPKENLVTEEEEGNVSDYEVNLPFQKPQEKTQQTATPQKTTTRKFHDEKEPLFIRIDKYKTAVEGIQDSKHKLMEIEKILADIKDLRSKEESELQEWEKQIQNAKSNIEAADKILFSQLE
jgi:hypothetical protein